MKLPLSSLMEEGLFRTVIAEADLSCSLESGLGEADEPFSRTIIMTEADLSCSSLFSLLDSLCRYFFSSFCAKTPFWGIEAKEFSLISDDSQADK